MTVFTHLTARRGILEHLRAYMIKDADMSDPEHYRTLLRGVQMVIDSLAAPADVVDDVRPARRGDQEPLQ